MPSDAAPGLARLQAGFRSNALLAPDAVADADLAALRAAIRADGVAPERRLAIHRNHYQATLVDALGGVFEATRALLGPAFFDGFARRLVREAPPAGPCLFEYGGGLPAALAVAPELEAHRYAADLARLEWAMHESFHAPAAPALNPSRLAAAPSDRLGAARLRPHPTLRLVAADFPVDDLWRGARAGAVAPDMLAGPATRLLLRRPDLDVVMDRASPGLYALLGTCLGGENLEAAAAATEAAGADFGETLGDGLGRGVFADAIDLDDLA